MNRLFWRYPLMDEVQAPTGESAGADGGAGAEAPTGESAGAGDKPADTEAVAETKPLIGEDGGQGEKGAEKPADGKGGKEEAKPATDEDYAKALVPDAVLLGKDVKLDADLYKAIVPTARELGVNPANLNKMANVLAKVQLDAERAEIKRRNDRVAQMNADAAQKYSQDDRKAIIRGIDRWFNPNGAMNRIIKTSELGADPEFLALMFHVSQEIREDGIKGAGNGAGSGTGDGNGINGLASIWK